VEILTDFLYVSPYAQHTHHRTLNHILFFLYTPPQIQIDKLVYVIVCFLRRREALVNSFCHRDYGIPKGNEIAIFRDRIEIYNAGAFPEGYTPEDFIKGKERSILQNPLIAETLYKSKEIEKWGSGLKRIDEECRSQNVRVEFETLKSGFMVVFYRDLEIKKTDGIQEGGGINGGIKGGINDLLEYIRNNPGKRANDLAKGINNSKRTTERWIRILRDEGKIEFRGSKKIGGYYLTIKDNGNELEKPRG